MCPDGGLLFLVLPLRCIESACVGREHFMNLLLALGLKEAWPVRITPKLAFYVMRRGTTQEISNNDRVDNRPKTQTKTYQSNARENNWRLKAEAMINSLPSKTRFHFSEERLMDAKYTQEFAIVMPKSFCNLEVL